MAAHMGVENVHRLKTDSLTQGAAHPMGWLNDPGRCAANGLAEKTLNAMSHLFPSAMRMCGHFDMGLSTRGRYNISP